MKHDLESFFAQSRYHMADTTRKAPGLRRAVAMGRILVGETGLTHVKQQTLPKGDALKLAEIAGVQGAKMAWQHIPLCHPLLLDHIAVCPQLEDKTHSVVVYAMVSTTAKTGAEMEALAAVNAALLTLYDLTKPVEPALTITDTRLLIKEGGKTGLWVHPDGIPQTLQALLPVACERPLEGRTAAVITLSDRASGGKYEDRSGPALKTALEQLGCAVTSATILPDEPAELKQKITELVGSVELIVTTGGTGLAPRDRTPQTLAAMADVKIPGIGELLRSHAADRVPTTWISRSLAVIVDNTLVIALPGSIGAVKDGVEALRPILAHALDHVRDKNPHFHLEPRSAL
ncbi:MAG: bifunctional molybdenum cofactor biosynthesis protein MoaC/MoaB [Hyphomicrobiales bacterium]